MAGKKPPVTRPGLDVLLGETNTKGHTPGAQRMPVIALRPGTGQPRREFDRVKLEELAASIRHKGVLQPLLVRPVRGGHEIVAGERRWRAAQLAGLTEVPVVVRELTDGEALEIAIIENLQREDLNLLEEVDGKLRLVESTLGLAPGEGHGRLMRLLREEPGEDHATLDRAFLALGESWSAFAKGKLRVLGWPEAVLEAVRGGLGFTLGAVVAGAPEEHQAALLALALGGATRAELRAESARLSRPAAERPRAARVGKLLNSARFLDGLAPADQRAVEKWLERMPAALKAAIE